MQIFTAIVESWTVPGAHVRSFITHEAAEAWIRAEFAEWLLPDLQEELNDEDSDLRSVEAWFHEAGSRIETSVASIEDYELVIDATNDIKDWCGSVAILQSELDTSELVSAERERIATCLEEEADLIPCAEDAEVTRGNALLVRADFSYEEADRLEEISSGPRT